MTTADADAVVAASHLFDYDAGPEWVERFLAQPDHHLGLAYVADAPAGFVSGVEVTHPDKGTEMFLYELAVDAQFQRRGIGNALVRAMAGSRAGLLRHVGPHRHGEPRGARHVHLQRRQRPQ